MHTTLNPTYILVSLGLVLLVLQFVNAIPLLSRIHATRREPNSGVSILTEAVWGGASTGWLLYSIIVGNAMLAISSILGMSVSLLLVLMFVTRDFKKILVPLGAYLVTVTSLFVVQWMFGVIWLGVALAVFGVVQFAPQLILSVKLLISGTYAHTASSMSALIRFIYCLGWAVYATLPHFYDSLVDYPLLVWGVFGAVTYGAQFLTTMTATSSSSASQSITNDN